MAESLNSELTPRKRPKQQRAKSTIDRIFKATRKLLTEEGPAAFSTRRVAAASGVNISSIYQYFPNKQAILYAMYQERLEAFFAVLDKYEQPEHLGKDPEEFFQHFFDEMDALQLSDSTGLALDKAIAHDEKLNQLNEAHGRKMIARITAILRQTGSTWPDQQLANFAEFIYSIDVAATELIPEKNQEEQTQIFAWNREVLMHLIRKCLKTA